MDPVRLITIVFFLGLVIFVHELGHYLAARWCGVLVERFSIGFGPILLSFRRGDTEYAISAVPLGGYVKMLGQSDTPTVDEPSTDPRSYQNKSVFQRMVIISAGVVMNIIFGIVCFAFAYSVGVPFLPAIVGATVPGKPAWQAGLDPGDTIIDVNGFKKPSYETLQSQVQATLPGTESVHLTVDRSGKQFDLNIIPVKTTHPMIGVSPSESLDIVDLSWAFPAARNSVAAAAKDPAFEIGDQVTAVDGKPVTTYQEYDKLLFDHRRDAVTIQVKRKAEKDNERPTADVKVGPAFIRTIGLRMTMGDVIGVRPDSPAAKAKDSEGKPKAIEPGDVIVGIDGQTDFDPMRLPDLVTDKAGQPVELTIRRKGRSADEFKVTVVPDNIPTWSDFPHAAMLVATPMSIPSLGIAYEVGTVIHSVEPGSPADKAGNIKPQDVVTNVEYFEVPRPTPPDESVWNKWFGGKADEANPKEKPAKEFDSVNFNTETKENGWPGAFWALQSTEVRKVKLSISRAAEGNKQEKVVVELVPVEVADWPFHIRGVNFDAERGIRKASNIVESLQMGMEYTWSTVARVYQTLRGLILRSVSPELLSGPLGLGYTAYVVSTDFTTLVRLIGMININLAVVNFLPIPVLDGGHMVFLLYELITRRKPSEKVLLASYFVGFGCIVSLMVFVLYLDIKHLFFTQ